MDQLKSCIGAPRGRKAGGRTGDITPSVLRSVLALLPLPSPPTCQLRGPSGRGKAAGTALAPGWVAGFLRHPSHSAPPPLLRHRERLLAGSVLLQRSPQHTR